MFKNIIGLALLHKSTSAWITLLVIDRATHNPLRAAFQLLTIMMG